MRSSLQRASSNDPVEDFGGAHLQRVPRQRGQDLLVRVGETLENLLVKFRIDHEMTEPRLRQSPRCAPCPARRESLSREPDRRRKHRAALGLIGHEIGVDEHRDHGNDFIGLHQPAPDEGEGMPRERDSCCLVNCATSKILIHQLLDDMLPSAG